MLTHCSTRFCLAVISGALIATLASAQPYASSPRIKPWSHGQDFIIAFDNFVAPDNGRDDLGELLTAIGPVTYTAFPTFTPDSGIGALTWPEARTFSEVFQAIQRHTFPADADIALTTVGLSPTGIGWLYPPSTPLNINGSRLFNFSARAEVGAGHAVTIGGMVVPGEFPRLVAFKVRGPSLAAFGIDAPLQDPRLDLFKGSDPLLANDTHTALRPWELRYAEALCPPPDDDREPMIITFLDPGLYTGIVSSADGGSGVALLEMYLLDTFHIE